MPYRKSNKEIQDSAFKLRSGNKSPLAYKLMGSSPAKHIVPYVVGEDYQDAEDHNTKHANEKKV